MAGNACLVDLVEQGSLVSQPAAKANEIASVAVHGVFREAPFHTQVLNVVIQRTVEGGGHTTRYHNPIGEPILCTIASDPGAPQFVDADLAAWYLCNEGNHDELLYLPFAWMFKR